MGNSQEITAVEETSSGGFTLELGARCPDKTLGRTSSVLAPLKRLYIILQVGACSNTPTHTNGSMQPAFI